ncbi:MAG TPA: ferritin family protein [Anaeromyxobacteraceae bacterium]|nr:ferritin family protein [Anaeromyxobacteraceae bacterium]
MARSIDLGPIDTRTALDLAIMVEEDAIVRYTELARLIGDDPGGAGDVCRDMAAKEQEDRDRLAARRAALRGGGPPRIDVSAADVPGEASDGWGEAPPATARAALERALAGERRAEAFYAALAGRASDPDARALLSELRAEEAHHADLLARKIARLDAGAPLAGLPCAEAAPPPAPKPRPRADAAALAAVLPRFDAATQAVARSLLVDGRNPDVVAWELGVTRRTVLRKLRRFLEAVPAGLQGGAALAATEASP